jgi:putative ABC transport system permease protein
MPPEWGRTGPRPVTPILLSPFDVAIAAVLIVLDAVLSLLLRLDLHRQLAIATVRLVIQLVLVGFILRAVFALASPLVTLGVVLTMIAIAGREVASRPEQRLGRLGNYAVGASAVFIATALTAILALTTAIRPHPWYDPHYAIPLAGIILGNVLNGASLALDSMLGGVVRERSAIEAQLCLGFTFRLAIRGLVRESVRRALLPIINQMSAAGIITLPGIMTGQILAGMDPFEAAQYQIVLMFLLSGGSGLAAVAVVYLAAARLTDERQRLRLDRLTAKDKGTIR